MKIIFLVITMVIFLQGLTSEEIRCGQRGSQEHGLRIINGTLASKGEFPWMISFRRKDISGYKHNCGGAIVSDSWILTAAHCVYNIEKDSLLVVAGVDNIKIDEDTKQVRKVAEVFTPHFDPATFANDIALLRLESPLEFGIHVMPICFPGSNQNFSGNAIVAGWGNNEQGKQTDLLYFVEINLVEKSICDYNYVRNGYSRFLNDCQLCAGLPDGGRDACQGDSGGPLICESDRKFIICGIVSWGIGCGRKEYPGVYTKVSCYMRWIENHIHAVTWGNILSHNKTQKSLVSISSPLSK